MTLPVDKKYNVRPFIPAPTIDSSKYPVIDLDAIDLSHFKEGEEGYESRKLLAQKLEKTITTTGFFNITNFGFDGTKLEYLKAIAQSIAELSDDEQARFYAGAATAEEDVDNKKNGRGAERSEGFKPKGFWRMKETDVRDSITNFNFRNAKNLDTFKGKKDKFPELFAEHLEEVHEYYYHLHTVVLRKILTLCDIILEIPEGTLYNKFYTISESKPLNEISSGYGRFMMYHPLTTEEAEKVDGTWLRGHSDICGFSIITSLPILSLQIQDYETGEWKYVNYRPNSLVVNTGDTMEFLTGGYFKASLHRVQLPPKEQQGYKRLILIDFVDPVENTIIHPKTLQSSKLIQVGLHNREEWDQISFKQWNNVKGKLLGSDGVGERSTLKFYGRAIERWHHVH